MGKDKMDKDRVDDPDLQELLNSMDDEEDVVEVPKGLVPMESESTESKLKATDPNADAPDELSTPDDIVKSISVHKKGILGSFEDDRLKIQEYIDMIIKDASGKGGFRNAHLEAISSLMATKAGTTANKVRILDVMIKLLSATKKSYGEPETHNMDEIQAILDKDDGELAP